MPGLASPARASQQGSPLTLELTGNNGTCSTFGRPGVRRDFVPAGGMVTHATPGGNRVETKLQKLTSARTPLLEEDDRESNV